jgi:hypothetical protein
MAKKSLTIGIVFIFISLEIAPSFSGENGFSNSNGSDDLPNIIWSKTYGSGTALSVKQTSDNGYILAGTTWEDATLIKTDENCSMEWVKHFGGECEDEGLSAIECTDGGYLCTGADGYPGGGLAETFLLKTDENGNELWYKTFRGEYDGWHSFGVDLLELPDGFVVLSSKLNFEINEGGTWLIKTDKDGNELWNKTYGQDWGDTGLSLIQSNDGGLIFTGYTYSYDSGIWLLKTDIEGNELWNKTYGCGDGNDVIQTDDGGYMIAGRYLPVYEAWHDVGLVKTDSSGNMEWLRHYGGTDQDSGYSVSKTDDGGYAVVGMRHSGLSSFQGWILKTDGNGNKLWDEVIGGRPNKVIKSNDGKIVVAGFKSGAWLMKVEDFENNPPGKPSHQYDKNLQQPKVVSVDQDGDRIR